MIAVVQLLGSHFQHIVQLGEEHVNALLLVFFIHTLDGKLHNIDGRERQVATSDRGSRTKAVFEYACTTTHRRHFVDVTFGVVSTPI